IDLDTIDVSNLNRQFLFRKRHVGQSKAKVAREAAMALCPSASIIAHHGSVLQPDFDVSFFSRFSLVLNALDNLPARRHVNRMCLAAGVPLIDSGTTGFLGQVTVHVKGVSQCYECTPKQAPKSYPTCTITNTPSKPVHCIVWAKELPFVALFGPRGQATDLHAQPSTTSSAPPAAAGDTAADGPTTTGTAAAADADAAAGASAPADSQTENGVSSSVEQSEEERRKKKQEEEAAAAAAEKEEREFFTRREGESGRAFACRVFDRIFGDNVARTLQMDDMWKHRARPTPLYLKDAFPAGVEESEEAKEGKEGKRVSAMARLGWRDVQKVWSVQENARVFLKAVELFVEERTEELGSLTFDKDDELAVEFVTAAANLRMHSFGIPLHSLFAAKGIAGNIVHAVATTNAIVAGLVVLQAVRLLEEESYRQEPRMVWCTEFPSQRKALLAPLEMDPPNPACHVCSRTPLVLELDTKTATLADVVEGVVRRQLSATQPMVMVGSGLVYEEGEDLEEDEVLRYRKNLSKKLCELPTPVTSGAVLTVEDYLQHFKCSIHIKHREDINEEDHPDKMILHGQLPAADTTAAAGEAGAAEAQNGEKKEGNAAGGEEDDDDDDDVVLFEPDAAGAAAGGAGETVGCVLLAHQILSRVGSMFAGGGGGVEKRVKVDVVEDSRSYPVPAASTVSCRLMSQLRVSSFRGRMAPATTSLQSLPSLRSHTSSFRDSAAALSGPIAFRHVEKPMAGRLIRLWDWNVTGGGMGTGTGMSGSNSRRGRGAHGRCEAREGGVEEGVRMVAREGVALGKFDALHVEHRALAVQAAGMCGMCVCYRKPTRGIVALGKFDALHVGHRALAVQAAGMGGTCVCMLSFAGMAEVLGWEKRLPLVAPCDRKRVLQLWQPFCHGQPICEFFLDFARIRSLSPEQFIVLLAEELRVKGIVAGSNYRFGFRAAGTASDLVELGAKHGLHVMIVDTVTDAHAHMHTDVLADSDLAPAASTAAAGAAGVAPSQAEEEETHVSSTRVRQQLCEGNVEAVAVFIARRHRILVSLSASSLSFSSHAAWGSTQSAVGQLHRWTCLMLEI
ncbi:unnamed protein product, partial [Closterium sp. Naga37s-1]